MNPEDDPKIRFVMARAIAREHLARAELAITRMYRVRYRARHHLAIANEAMRTAEEAAIEIAVKAGEERAIEQEVWRGSKTN